MSNKKSIRATANKQPSSGPVPGLLLAIKFRRKKAAQYSEKPIGIKLFRLLNASLQKKYGKKGVLST
jgi:hypothetical protein